jgi:hypothetical protein
MRKVIAGKDERFLLLVERSGSHSLAAAALQQWNPEQYEAWVASGENAHPAKYLPNFGWPWACETPAIIVRNPVERFRSMCVHKAPRTVAEQLEEPSYGPLPGGTWSRCFRFEDQLQECADWLGITVPLSRLSASTETDKPTLTIEEEARVREIYAADIALWESLQP